MICWCRHSDIPVRLSWIHNSGSSTKNSSKQRSSGEGLNLKDHKSLSSWSLSLLEGTDLQSVYGLFLLVAVLVNVLLVSVLVSVLLPPHVMGDSANTNNKCLQNSDPCPFLHHWNSRTRDANPVALLLYCFIRRYIWFTVCFLSSHWGLSRFSSRRWSPVFGSNGWS